MFFGCRRVEEVWRHAGLLQVVREKMQGGGDFGEVFFSLLNCGSVPRAKATAMIFWCIWKWHNERVWERLDRPVGVSGRISMDVLHDWESVRLL